jgi:predicted DNA-binding antitoxin AbrB/MazE fold protein
MVLQFQATYENGVLRPSVPLALPEQARVEVTVVIEKDQPAAAENDEGVELRPEAPRLTAAEFRRIVDRHALRASQSLPLDFDRHDIYSDHD